MNAKESLPHALGRKALDAMIRREYGGTAYRSARHAGMYRLLLSAAPPGESLVQNAEA